MLNTLPAIVAPFCCSSEDFKFRKALSFTITPFPARAQLRPYENPGPSLQDERYDGQI